jgi:RNA polymerase sigma factor (sigma-70 family)
MATRELVEGRPLDDNELVARAREGDDRAYEELVRRHQDVAFRVALLVSGNSADAEDAAQEALVKAYYALDRFRLEAPFRPWLLRIVANEARNRRRSAGRRDQLAFAVSGERSSGDAAPSPEETALEHERRTALLAALGRLREPDRQVITCRYLLELSEAETAEALGWRAGTVKSRLSRALPRLRDELAAQAVGALPGGPHERRAQA